MGREVGVDKKELPTGFGVSAHDRVVHHRVLLAHLGLLAVVDEAAERQGVVVGGLQSVEPLLHFIV